MGLENESQGVEGIFPVMTRIPPGMLSKVFNQ